jgi:hypothetical protein
MGLIMGSQNIMGPEYGSDISGGDSRYKWNFLSFFLLGEQDNSFSRTPSLFVLLNPTYMEI